MSGNGRRLAAALSLLLPLCGGAAAEDLHQLWDQRCGACHGHAGTYARQSLRMVDGRLVSERGGRDVADFLRTHNGGYSPDHIAAIIAWLGEQVSTPDLFHRKCGGCHQTAAALARASLLRDNGVLVGRDSGRPVAELLRSGHGGLDEQQTVTVLDALDRVEREVHHP